MNGKWIKMKCPMCGREEVFLHDSGWKECKACGWWTDDR